MPTVMTESPPAQSATAPALPVPLARAAARDIVEQGIRRYIARRRERVPGFVDRHFSFAGALRLHRHAVGLDLARAPINVGASLATAGKRGLAFGLRWLGRRETATRLDRTNLFLETAVGREIAWLVQTELLELPAERRGRNGTERATQDALIDAILEDPRVGAHFAATLGALGRHLDDIDLRARLTETLAEYVGSRAAAADISGTLVTAAAGLATYQKFTPGIAALSGVITGQIAHAAAVNGFFAGAWAGKLYYAVFAASASPLLYAGVFAALILPVSMLAAFAGIVADPLQRRLGLHRRRLDKMLDALERTLLSDTEARFSPRDHYVARLVDLFDWTYVAYRAATR
jgi:hypothetical protein